VAKHLPSGTVTFLFTDVEGSTRLLHDLGIDRYAAALADHCGILRRPIGAVIAPALDRAFRRMFRRRWR